MAKAWKQYTPCIQFLIELISELKEVIHIKMSIFIYVLNYKEQAFFENIMSKHTKAAIPCRLFVTPFCYDAS